MSRSARDAEGTRITHMDLVNMRLDEYPRLVMFLKRGLRPEGLCRLRCRNEGRHGRIGGYRF
jgi:hypothetical protein